MKKVQPKMNGNKKSVKPQDLKSKKKARMRRRIFVKGNLNDGQKEITANESPVERPISTKSLKLHKKRTVKNVSKDTLTDKGMKQVYVKRQSTDNRQPSKKKSITLGEFSGKEVPKENSQSKQLKNKLAVKEKQNTGKILPAKVQQAVRNLKASKEMVSSNWTAFKDSGLHLKKVKSESNSDFQGVFRNKRKLMESGNSSAKDDVKDDAVVENRLDTLDLDDCYIKDLVPPEGDSIKKLTGCVAIDCEMVGVGDGKENALARVSIVNQHGACVYDKFVKTKEDVADYRTKVSGVRPADLALGAEFEVVQKDVANIVAGRILVGHALRHDMKVLFLSHPYTLTRDTSKFKPFKDMFNGKTPSLKNLALKVLGVNIQEGEHSSVEDAKATMQLYNMYRKEWEEQRKLWASRKHEKMVKATQGQKAGATQHSQSGTAKERSGKKSLPHIPSVPSLLGNNIADEYAAF